MTSCSGVGLGWGKVAPGDLHREGLKFGEDALVGIEDASVCSQDGAEESVGDVIGRGTFGDLRDRVRGLNRWGWISALGSWSSRLGSSPRKVMVLVGTINLPFVPCTKT